jgi:hypothetical protein
VRIVTIPQAKARNSDPTTSWEAADKVEGNGKAQAQRNEVLNALGTWDSATSAELAHLMGIDRHIPARRLPELRDGGFVANGEPQICKVTGNRSMTWHIR